MNDRVAIVTGAAKGIGRSTADKLLQDGYKVVFGYNRTPPRDIEGQANALALRMDVSSQASVKQAVDATMNRWGRIDVLVNNAGVSQRKPFLELTTEDWVSMFSVNLFGAVWCCQEVIPIMLKNRFGRIINISSVGGQWGGVYQVHYAASKAAMINLTRSLAKLYSAQGLTSNCLALGAIETDMIKEELPKTSNELQEFYSKIPVGHIGQPDEVAAAVQYLCSSEASFVTGQTLNINGGIYFG